MTGVGCSSCVDVELNRAFRNTWFVVALLVGVALALTSAALQIDRYLQYVALDFSSEKYYPPHIYNCFGMWMSVEFINPTSLLFYRMAPLLAAGPFSWSLGEDFRTGYISQLRTRKPMPAYIIGKLTACFLVGGIVVVFPQLVNFVAIACFVPAYMPDITDAMYLGIFDDNLFSGLFYGSPVLYVLSYCALDFILAGLWSGFVACVSYFVRNRVLTIAAPYLALAIIQVVNERIFILLGGIKGIQLSLFENLRAATSMYVQSMDVIVAESMVLLLFVALSVWAILKRDCL